MISNPYPNIHHIPFLAISTMQQAIPYKSWIPLYTNPNPTLPEGVLEGSPKNMLKMVSENAVIVFAKRGCCMSHVVKRLLLGLGVNPAVYEVDEEDEVGVVGELETIWKGDEKINNNRVQFPAVFIGGRLFGGLDKVMATHISGDLVPILKEAGALWL